MKFSILMPVYNAGVLLERSIGSVLNQSCGDFELLCCDDCSTDGSLNRLREYAANDPRIRVISNSVNRGRVITRNALIKEFDGEYCVWLDQDDELHPDFLLTAEKYIDQGAWDMVHFQFVNRYADGRENLEAWHFTEYRGEKLLEHFARHGYFLWQMWSRAIKKEVMKKSLAPEINPQITDDVYFTMLMSHHAASFCSPRIAEPMYIYYADIGGYGGAHISLERYKVLCRERREMFQYNYDFLTRHGYKFTMDWMYYIHNIGVTLWQVTQLATVEERNAAFMEFQKYFGISLQPRPYNMPFYAPGCEPEKTNYSFVAPKIKI